MRKSVATTLAFLAAFLLFPNGSAAQNGLLGEYFNNQDFTGIRATRIDPNVNFDWGEGSPIAGIDIDTFSVRWTGELVPRFSETYTFHVRSDDGERLWVNGQRICNGWSPRLATTDTGTITLQAGQRYLIQLEFFDQTVSALVSLAWSSASQPYEIIPASQLFQPVPGSNRPPNNPILLHPQVPNTTVDAEQFSPRTDFFSDPDTGNTHRCTEWEIWTVSPPERVWSAGCTNGLLLRSVTLQEGVFQNSHAGRTSLKYYEQYNLRVRFKDSSGAAATEWSRWTERTFNTAQPITTLIPTRSSWRYRDDALDLGTSWRGTNYDDTSWFSGVTQIGFGDGDEFTICCGARPLTAYFRKQLSLTNASLFTNVLVRLLRDDGGVVYINGTEVFRSNLPGGPLSYSTLASSSVPEADETQNFYSGALSPGLLRNGTNVVAVEIHQSSTTSGDLSFDLELLGVYSPAAVNPAPRILSAHPTGAEVTELTNIIVTFSEPVSGVDAADLLLNNTPATTVLGGSGNSVYTFSFPQPPYGPVTTTWSTNHGILDFDSPPRAFDAKAPGSTFHYTLVNPNAPVITTQLPAAAAIISNLTQLRLTFSKPVTGLDAQDLLINGIAATNLLLTNQSYIFRFQQPPYGPVSIAWATNHNIADLASNWFEPFRTGNTWGYTLIDLTPPAVASQDPPAWASVTNLTQISVTFREPVTGVVASDLLVNGKPAIAVTGTNATYTFAVEQPNASLAAITWAANHNIKDSANNTFDAEASSSTWHYFTLDNIPPGIARIFPPPGATLRSLDQIEITFTEPVTGLGSSDFLVNGEPVTNVRGSGAGPYTFGFPQPATGQVAISWAAHHGVADLAVPQNSLSAGPWDYTLDPQTSFAGKVLFSEIMYQPASRRSSDEWLEILNVSSAPVNLHGWRIAGGVDFTFPNISLGAGQHLVIAANPGVFRTNYPNVTNLVGGWVGNLANNDQTIRLETALGEEVNNVQYASQGDWALRVRGPLSRNHRGWIWTTAADGFGSSLELRNPALPNRHGQNWRYSPQSGGTPGRRNSLTTTNVAPLITGLAHTPVVPRSSDPVVISASILDEHPTPASVTLFYRNAATLSPGPFLPIPMFDDGTHQDGAAEDKIFAGIIPPQTNDAVIEFYVEALDAVNQTNTCPAPALNENGVAGQFANALYQVDDRTYNFSQPLYKLIMTEAERQERDIIATIDPQSNAEMNATLITIDGTGTEVRYNCGLRERGAGSRGYVPANQRVNVPTDRRWKGQREFNLNTLYTHAQYAGYLLSLRSGLDTENARMVRVRLNNRDQANAGSPQYGCYIHVEAPNADMAEDHFPLDGDGNMYRASSGSHSANLAYLGTNWPSYSSAGYNKVSNTSENDWSDLVNLTFALSSNTPDSNYAAAVRANLNVEQWMLYFAVNTLLVNNETSLATGNGDDYGLYRGTEDTRFVLFAHDWDTILGQGSSPGSATASLFRMTSLPALNRFMNWPEFTPIYLNTLRQLCRTSFAPQELGSTLDEGLGSFVPQSVINGMKTFASNRVAYVLSQLPPDTNTPVAAPSFFGGTVTNNRIFIKANSPYVLTFPVTVASGATLTIEPGTTVRFNTGAGLTVANGGRLLAEGTQTSPILFTRNGTNGNWGNLVVHGSLGSPETRLVHARLEFNATSPGTPAIQVSGGTVFLDHLSFGNTAAPYIHVDGASFVISHCQFPSASTPIEFIHGSGGVRSDGRGIFYRNWFGVPIGYNDVIDFTGGNRPNQPIVHFVENVFTGATDDILDLDGTDAWIEGNIFLHAHKNGSPDSASAISGGRNGADRSELTVIGNIIYDCDHAANAKEGNFYTFYNNTIVRQTHLGGTDIQGAVLLMSEPGTTEGAGAYLEGNIFYDAERLVLGQTNSTITFSNNILANIGDPAWIGPGGNNNTTHPRFKHIPQLGETTNFTNWASAQVLRDWLSLGSNSPAIAAGPNGADLGAIVPLGARVSVQPGPSVGSAVLQVGLNRQGPGSPTAGWINGAGYTHYKWRLDDGPWSPKVAVDTPVTVPGFFSGSHRVDITGKRDSGLYQDNLDFQESATVTSIFSNPAQAVRIHELLASNQGAFHHHGTYPDFIELHNPNGTAVDISGLRLSDDPTNPGRFTFPPGTTIPADGFLVVFANDPDGTPGLHTGFALRQAGQSVFLHDSIERGGVLLDSVSFGLQLTDYSLGRLGTNWSLCTPTFLAPNIPAPVGDPTQLLINEILAASSAAFPSDFVEIYNPQPWPVAMGGLYFTENPAHWPTQSPIPSHTFINANSYLVFHADGTPEEGPDHLAFKLAAERGLVALLNSDQTLIDCILYGPQTTDISTGRSPLNGARTNLFLLPSPGSPNPSLSVTNQGIVINEILTANSSVFEPDGTTPDWLELFNLSTNTVDLTDHSLTDTSLNPRKYVFAPGTVLPARAHLRLRCDLSLPASSTNTGFNLRAEGGSLFLFKDLASGGGLLNTLSYGLQVSDFSIGRVPDGTGAFALAIPTPNSGNIPATLANVTGVRINEWMADPDSGEDWFELWNPAPQPVAIGGLFLTDNPNQRTKFPIPALSFLGASTNGYQRFWADNLPGAGANHATFKLDGTAGEYIGFGSAATLIDAVSFGPQQTGASEGRFPDGTATFARFPRTASPGEDNYLPLTQVAINEALTHSDPPFEDAIELLNLTSTNVNIGGWWLSDSRSALRKYRVPDGTVLAPHTYLVLYENQFNAEPDIDLNAFALGSTEGDEIHLSEAAPDGTLTGYRASVRFGAAAAGVSFGRHITSDGREEFVAMSARSLGQDAPTTLEQFRSGTGLPNPYPLVGPLVMSQIMYPPVDAGTNDNSLDEFIELRNITQTEQPLYDRFFPSNTWRLRDAVSYDFPQGLSIAPGGTLLLVSFDPLGSPFQLAAFRAKYGIDANTLILGPYSGKLRNSDGKVELYKPANPVVDIVPYILADRVHYYDNSPWPIAADGFGSALLRLSLTGFADDPTNWIPSTPNFNGAADNDSDGIPDSWEELYGLNKHSFADAGYDPDGDGHNNLAEYRSGTNPQNSESVLRLAAALVATSGTNAVRLQFTALSNQAYTVEYRDNLSSSLWHRLTDVSAATNTRQVQLTDPLPPGAPHRFYRVQTHRP